MKKLLLWSLLVSMPLQAAFTPEAESKILYLSHKGEITQAFTCYLEEAKKHSHNYPLLQLAGISILEEGIKNSDLQIQLLSVLGAGVALNKSTLPFLKQAIRSSRPELQLASLHLLARFEEDEALLLLEEALSSPVLLVRLEAALILAEMQQPIVIDHLSSFYGKVPPQARVLFPQILGEIETEASTKFLKQLLSETEVNIRVATIIQAGLAQRDDILDSIRMLLTHPGYMEAEASAFAIGKFQDLESKDQLSKLASRKNPEVKLSALQALYEIGEKQNSLANMIQMAKEKNLFAISVLGECPNSPAVLEALQKLSREEDFDTQLNASLSLLKLKDSQALPFFQKLFLADRRDFGFQLTYSPGKALSYWKSVPSYSQKLEKEPRLEEQTHRFRAQILRRALELPEEDFLKFANAFFEKDAKNPLIPLLLELICDLRSEKSLNFLKAKQELAGAPFIRAYTTLALYKLTHEEIYEDKLISFIKQERGKEFILHMPKDEGNDIQPSPHILSAKETSAFLLNAFETLAASPRPKVVEALVEAIAYGNPKNRYALAGLLIRMAE